ncbi:hypothetical protein MTR_4g128920 [Medicago truncatula]|uniref:Uncharacterized protein n=1 Tax=Medicago truncatula TaxID=3880 RepID=G7JD45_MEDTR|nr:hypothetical protein MTR_4g128920 [Medicago truncatula]
MSPTVGDLFRSPTGDGAINHGLVQVDEYVNKLITSMLIALNGKVPMPTNMTISMSPDLQCWRRQSHCH